MEEQDPHHQILILTLFLDKFYLELRFHSHLHLKLCSELHKFEVQTYGLNLHSQYFHHHLMVKVLAARCAGVASINSCLNSIGLLPTDQVAATAFLGGAEIFPVWQAYRRNNYVKFQQNFSHMIHFQKM